MKITALEGIPDLPYPIDIADDRKQIDNLTSAILYELDIDSENFAWDELTDGPEVLAALNASTQKVESLVQKTKQVVTLTEKLAAALAGKLSELDLWNIVFDADDIDLDGVDLEAVRVAVEKNNLLPLEKQVEALTEKSRACHEKSKNACVENWAKKTIAILFVALQTIQKRKAEGKL